MSPGDPDARQVLTGEQCREARQLLGISKDALARAANVYPETVERFENSGQSSTFPIRAKLRAALESAGVVFTNGEQPGVRLRKVKA